MGNEELVSYIKERLSSTEKTVELISCGLSRIESDLVHIHEKLKELNCDLRKFIDKQHERGEEIKRIVKEELPRLLDEEFERRTSKGKHWAFWGWVGVNVVVILLLLWEKIGYGF